MSQGDRFILDDLSEWFLITNPLIDLKKIWTLWKFYRFQLPTKIRLNSYILLKKKSCIQLFYLDILHTVPCIYKLLQFFFFGGGKGGGVHNYSKFTM